MNRIKKIIIFAIILLFFLALIIIFNIYKKTGNYRDIIKYLEVFTRPLFNKNESIIINRLKSYRNIQKEFWIKNSLNNIRDKEENEEPTVNEYLEEALILTSVDKKDEAKAILKNILSKQNDEEGQRDSIKKIKERLKSGENKEPEKSSNTDTNFKDEDINYKLIDMLFEELVEDQEIGFARELYLKKEEIKSSNKAEKSIEKKKSNTKTADEPTKDISTSFYDRLKSSDEVKEFVNKGEGEEEYNIVLEVLDKAYEDKLINIIFYNESKDFIVKKIE